jgi:hypothetical protein
MVEFVTDRLSYNTTLKGHWCDIVRDMHAPTKDKDDVIKNGLYKELERVFAQSPRYHMKIFLGNFNAKGGREDFLNQ